ncbi:MAG: hypothetical protein WKF86_02260 [Acidimicrobiales bacterium]
MGLVRKTLSISTVGLVSFRSKKEKLRRAEAEREVATAELLREQKARELAEHRVVTAEKKAHVAELLALKAAGDARKASRKERSRKEKEPKGRLEDAMANASRRAKKARARAEAKAKEARARAEKEATRARRRAKKGVEATVGATGAAVAAAEERVKELID